MKLSALLPISLLLGPSSARPSRRASSAAHSHQLSHIPIPSIPGPSFHPAGSPKIALTSSASTSPESTKAGARLAGGSNITSVSAVFRIPSAEMPISGPTAGNENGVYQASYWVGIDGLTASSCGGVGMRAGVDTFWDAGERSAGVWWEWYPAQGPSQFEGGFEVGQGDVVRITAAADVGGLGGEVLVEKMDGTGCEAKVLGSARKRFDGLAEGERLCLGEAAVVIEDYPIVGRPEVPLPFANFTEVVFERVKVGGVKAEGLEVFDVRLEAQGGRLTDCEAGEGRVDCRRVVGDE